MTPYTVTLTETLSTTIIVYASNEAEAVDMAQYAYDNEEIILTSDDYIQDSLKVECTGPAQENEIDIYLCLNPDDADESEDDEDPEDTENETCWLPF